MDRDAVLAACLALAGAVEDYPFGDDVPVCKVGGKMFALLSPDGTFVNLKCDPSVALELRDRFPGVRPGYHSNKRHWNSVVLDGSVPDDELQEMIEHSYELVVGSLPVAVRSSLQPPS